MKIKDRLKINVFPSIVLILHKLGFTWEKLGNTFLTRSVLLAQAKKLSRFKTDDLKEEKQIYILLMLSGSLFHLFIETLLALGLKKRGCEITFIMDDHTLPIHELKKINEEHNWDYLDQRNFVYASKFLNTLKLKYIPISEFVSDASEEDLKYNNIYDSVVEATLLKHYKVGIISEKLPNLNKKKELVKEAITITHYIGEKLSRIKPDIVIMSHGIYSTWGPPFQVLNNNNIPILVHGRGKKRHSQVYNWNKTGDSWDVSEEWEKIKNKDLNDTQLKNINEYLDSRISHKNDVFVYNFGKETSITETISNLGLDPNKPIYTLFTNVLWDAASAQREIAFDNPVEWVIETIAWFNRHPEKQLIVKIHPAEVVIGTNMPFYDIIVNEITPESNVRIIKPAEKVNSWSIYDISDLGIVHTTTAGMEMPLVYKPCMVVSKTHYRNKGFTIDVESREEYFEILQNFDNSTIDYDLNRKKAIKYAYLLFMKYQVPFNMFYEENSTEIKGFRYDSIEKYMKDQIFSGIIENIILKNNILNESIA